MTSPAPAGPKLYTFSRINCKVGNSSPRPAGSFQHPNISSDMLGCCSPKGESERKGVRKPLPPPLHCERSAGDSARARAGARACAHTWEIHIPELRPGPIRDRLGPEKGADGGSESANMSKKRASGQAFCKFPLFFHFLTFSVLRFFGPPSELQKYVSEIYQK